MVYVLGSKISQGESRVENTGKFRFFDFKTRKHYYTDTFDQCSATDLKSSRECTWKIWNKLTQTVKPPKSVPLVVGSIFHAVIEECLKHKAKTGLNLSWEATKAFFEAKWTQGTIGLDFGKTTPEKAKMKALAYTESYFKGALPMLYLPVAAKFRPNDWIEKFFCVPVTYQDKTIRISGKCDCVTRDMYLIDHKSASSFGQWTLENACEEIQPYLYSFVFKKLGIDIRGFRYYVTDGSEVRVFDVPYNESRVADVLQEAFDLKERIESGSMLRAKSERTCSWCDYKGICPHSLVPKEDIDIGDL